MKMVVEQVRRSLQQDCYLPALALALTIPDACGKIAFPKLTKSKERYIHWYNQWALDKFADHQGFGDDKEPVRPYFNADMCYKLRCEFLHANSTFIKPTPFENQNEPIDDYDFELTINGSNSYGITTWVGSETSQQPSMRRYRVRIDIATLCNSLCTAADQFLQTLDDDGVSFSNTVSVVDIKKELQSLGLTED